MFFQQQASTWKTNFFTLRPTTHILISVPPPAILMRTLISGPRTLEIWRLFFIAGTKSLDINESASSKENCKVLSIDESGPNQEEVLTKSGWQQQSIQVQSGEMGQKGIDNIGSSTADGVAKERQNEMGQQCESKQNNGSIYAIGVTGKSKTPERFDR
ncbi:hypothetical protein KY290_012933 [Solanum tuberosum]|uniref:Uncharacterized protein n=1 Tax=Solanum tuberosum TaxID=4113 RepID=A0ABQ7VK98_SOLTU|nr:hypothetical protein KY285_012702 [Solanum tuberosum]KAH0768952.1 hypothetical protein KY290_012933 [Solanum tuberosum]